MKRFASPWKSISLRANVLRRYHELLETWASVCPDKTHYKLSGLITRILIDHFKASLPPVYPDPSIDCRFDDDRPVVRQEDYFGELPPIVPKVYTAEEEAENERRFLALNARIKANQAALGIVPGVKPDTAAEDDRILREAGLAFRARLEAAAAAETGVK
jgi:hypothetical protein